MSGKVPKHLRADDCRAKAAEYRIEACRDRVRQSHRAMIRHIAETWERIAEEIEEEEAVS